MRKVLLFLITTLISISAFSQFGYKYQMETVDGIEIKYKVVHSKFFDKSSPLELRLKLKNTNDYDVNLDFEIQYSIDLTKKYKSGSVNICIPRKSARTGKMHGLMFEIIGDDPKLFESDDADWEFIQFEIEQTEDCDVI
jgi:hypothetical protein